MVECREPTVEEIKKWLRENYGPEWENKVELGRILWKKKFCNESKYSSQISSSRRNVEYNKVNIGNIPDKAPVLIEGIVIDKDFVVYQGCPVCGRSVRKGCQHLNSGEVQPVDLRISNITISDGTGEVEIGTLLKPGDEDPFENIQIGDLVQVKGYARHLQNGVRVYMDEINVLKSMKAEKVEEEQQKFLEEQNVKKIDDLSPNAQKFLRYLMNTGGIKRELALMLMERQGVMMDEIKDFIVDDGNMISVKEGVI